MTKVDISFVEEASLSTAPSSSSLEKQLQVVDPESLAIGDNENPEFKLPKMGSLVVVLITNLLMQVISHLLLTDWSHVNLVLIVPETPDLFFHHRSVIQHVCGTVGRWRHILWSHHRHPNVRLGLDPRPSAEVR